MDKLGEGDPIRDRLVSFFSCLRVYSSDFLGNQFNTREIAAICLLSLPKNSVLASPLCIILIFFLNPLQATEKFPAVLIQRKYKRH